MEAPEIPEFPQFVHETVTRWSDDDSQGVLNNAVYLTLFEEARHGFSRAAEVLIEGQVARVAEVRLVASAAVQDGE